MSRWTSPDMQADPAGSIGAEIYLDLIRARFACRKFDPARSLSGEETGFILECGRLSPSSFGLEPWEFVAIRSREAIARMEAACFDQEAVGSAALVVCILVRLESDFAPDSDFVRQRGARFPGGLELFVPDYEGYYRFLRDAGRLKEWSRAQGYLACANMMTGARAVGIDSIAIEGFRETEVLALCDADPADRAVSLVIAFGHAAQPVAEKIREPLPSLARFID